MTEASAAASSSSGSKLEPFLILARSTKPRGAAAAKLVQQVTEANGVFAFSELFEIPGVAELSASEELVQHHRLLELFAYGTLQEYKASPGFFPELTAAQLLKLRQLTLVSLASQTRALPYAALFDALDMPSGDVRELEDLIIDSTYAGLMGGKLNQIKQRFEVEGVIGRDVRGEKEIDAILHQLENWSNTTQNVLTGLEERIGRIRSTEAESQNARQRHNEDLLASLQKVQQTIQAGASGGNHPAWAGGDRMDVDGLEDPSARGGLRKKVGSSGSTQRNKRSRA